MLQDLVYAKYPRPRKLSDPHADFTPDMLESLLNKDDAELGWAEYARLLGPHLPAGTYEEVIYFLPKAFSYLRHHEDDALDLVDAVFGFCSVNIERLRQDDLELSVKQQIMACLKHWAREFRVKHYDAGMCQKKGWRLDYFDLVQNSETICEGTTVLAKFETLSPLAIEFTRFLAFHEGDITRASWFLELSRARSDVYRPPGLPEIQNLLSDKRMLRKACAVIGPQVHKQNPTYWRDTLRKLEM